MAQNIIYSPWERTNSPWLCLMTMLLLFSLLWLFSFVLAFFTFLIKLILWLKFSTGKKQAEGMRGGGWKGPYSPAPFLLFLMPFYWAVNPLLSQLPSCISKTMLPLPLALYLQPHLGTSIPFVVRPLKPLYQAQLHFPFPGSLHLLIPFHILSPHLHPVPKPLLSLHPRPSLLYLNRMWLRSHPWALLSPFTLPGKHHLHGTPIAQDGATAAPPAPPLPEAGPTWAAKHSYSSHPWSQP